MPMLDSIVANDELFNLIENKVNRSMFILFYYWGLTYKEIAYCFNIPEELVMEQLRITKEAVSMHYE